MTISLRHVELYALTREAGLPLGVTGKTALLNLLNAEAVTGVTLSASNVTLTPKVVSDQPNFNSLVEVKGSPALGYTGAFSVYYNRVGLSQAFVGKDTKTLPVLTGSIHQSLAAINSAFGLQLETIDVVDKPLTAADYQVVLTASETSCLYTPGSAITLGSPRTMQGNFTSFDLDGFDPA